MFWSREKIKEPQKHIFEVGQIFKMLPTPNSHTKNPYFVEVIEIGKDYIVTDLPGEHSLKISHNNNWNYHIARMEYVGEKETHGHLLFKQDLTRK